MKKVIGILVAITVVFIFIWNFLDMDYKSYNHTYTGESDNYKARLEITGKEIWYKVSGRLYHYSIGGKEFELIYKGSEDELQEINQIECEYDLGTLGGSRTINNPNSHIIIKRAGLSSSSWKNIIEAEKHVQVITDGVKENFTLISE